MIRGYHLFVPLLPLALFACGDSGENMDSSDSMADSTNDIGESDADDASSDSTGDGDTGAGTETDDTGSDDGDTGGDGEPGGDYCDALWSPDTEIWVDNEAGSPGGSGTEADPVDSIAGGVAMASGKTHALVQATDTAYEGVCVETKEVAILGMDGRPKVDGIVECDGRNALFFSRADDVWFVGFRLDTSANAGESARALLFSGIVEAPINRNYGCDLEAVGPGQGQAGRSLISSSLCYDCVLEDSSSIGAEEHGIYWTNHQDGSILRNNYVSDADGACIQLNADPETYDGGNGIQDGHMSGGIVEGNIMFDCGNTDGGAALNLAGVTDTVFRNNVIYGSNNPGGIANWDDGYSDWGDPGNFDFGCTGNTFAHNTIDCRGCDRHALSFRNGSTNNTFVDNIVITDSDDAIAYDDESSAGLDIDYNIYAEGVVFEPPSEDWIDLGEWQALGFDENSFMSAVGGLFEAPDSGDYHLPPGSPAVDAGIDAGVSADIEATPRPQGAGFDIGAYERQ